MKTSPIILLMSAVFLLNSSVASADISKHCNILEYTIHNSEKSKIRVNLREGTFYELHGDQLIRFGDFQVLISGKGPNVSNVKAALGSFWKGPKCVLFEQEVGIRAEMNAKLGTIHKEMKNQTNSWMEAIVSLQRQVTTLQANQIAIISSQLSTIEASLNSQEPSDQVELLKTQIENLGKQISVIESASKTK